MSEGNDEVVVASAHAAPKNDGLPMPGFRITPGNTALMITDPQNDFLSPDGVAWGVVGKSVTENNTVENIETLFKVQRRRAAFQSSSRRTTTTPPTTRGSSRARSRP